MANRTVSVRLQAEIGQYVSSMSKASAVTMRVGDDAMASGKKAKGGFDVAGKGALLMGGAVVAGLGMAVSASMKFESAMSAAQSATQATGGALNDLRDAAMKAGADTQYSATEAAQAITEMGKAGVSTADILGGGLDGALALAAAGQLDVGRAAEIASVAMTQFNLSGEDLPHVADLLAAGAGKAMGSVEDLGAALGQAGLVADAAGLDIEETTGVLAAFASAGLVGSDAGTSLKTMLQQLQAPSGKASELMAELGINMYDANGNMLGASEMAGVLQESLGGLTEEERNAALATIFGSDAVRAANVLYKEGASGIADWTAKVNDQGYAAETAAALNDNLKGDLERLGGAFETLMIQMGSGAQGPLREIVQAFTGILDIAAGVLSFWSDLPGPVKLAVGAFAAITAFKGPLGTLFDTLATKAVLGIDSLLEMSKRGDGAAKSLGNLAKALGPGLALGGAVLIASDVIGFISKISNAGDEARGYVDDMNRALGETDGNTAALDATANAISDLRDRIAEARDVVEAGQYEDIPWLTQAGSDAKDAAASIEVYEEQLRALETQQRNTEQATGNLAAKFNLSKSEVQELADKYGLDLTDGLRITQVQFEELYTKEYGTTPVDAANSLTGAVMSAKEQTEEAIKAQEDWLKSLQDVVTGFIDPLGAYSGLLDAKMTKERESAEATAAATEDGSDSWEDYATDVTVSLDELADKLEEQLTAHADWARNIGVITQRGGEDVGRILAGMGEEGVQIAAQMADGTDAEFNRMADLLKQGAQRAGMDAVTEFDYYMRMMQIVGASGGKATAATIAEQLGIGVDDVARIAADYGVVLADGINPLLRGLGKSVIQVNGRGAPRTAQSGGGVQGRNNADGNLYEAHQAEIAPGGAWRIWAEPETGGEAYIPLSPSKRARSLDIWRETGLRLGIKDIENYANGGFFAPGSVPRPPSTSPYAFPISTPADATMQKGYDETSGVVAYLQAVAAANAAKAAAASASGPIGGGPAGSSWQSLWAKVHAAFPSARMTSNYRPGDSGYHGRGKAVDVAAARPGDITGMMAINRWAAATMGGSLSQLIFTPGINLLNGRPHTYNAATRADHYDHVHMATYKQGTPYVPQTGPALLHQGEAVIPAHLNPNAREFSGAGGSGTVAARVDHKALAEAIIAAGGARTVQLYTPNIPEAVRALKADERQQAAMAPAW